MTPATSQEPTDGRGAFAWLIAAWAAAFLALATWYEGWAGLGWGLLGTYVGCGVVAAVLLPAWRLRTFQSRHLPAEAPDAPGFNVRLTSALIACLVCLLWPLYWRLSVTDEQRRRARPDSASDRDSG